jgi:glycosyltransferase involved in cell wall biosynthesis
MTGRSNAPAVSVVTIFKDEERFLSEAIESVLAQSFDAWELLLVDDGSSDKSTALARRYAGRCSERIRYLEHNGHANLGMSASRNLGIARARGELVAFLDADDVLLPAALERQVEALRTRPRVGMVYGPLEYWHGWTGRREDAARDVVQPTGVPAEGIYEPLSLLSLFLRNIAYSPAGVIVRRTLARQVGGFEKAFRDLYEDQVFAAKVCVTAPVYVSGTSFYRYRQHPESCCLTAEREGRLNASREPFLRWLVGFLEEQGLEGTEPWMLARIELGLASRSRTSAFVRRLTTAIRARMA